MNVCAALERDLGRTTHGEVPAHWRAISPFDESSRLDDLIRSVRRLDHRSDLLVESMLRVGVDDEVATATLIVALLPLVLGRCRGRSDCMDEMVGELALVIAEVKERELPATHRRLASLLVDRAWDRVRHHRRKWMASLPSELSGLAAADRSDDPETTAVNRVAIHQIRRQLVGGLPAERSVVSAWNSMIELSERAHRTRSEADRLKYARRILRRRLDADLAA